MSGSRRRSRAKRKPAAPHERGKDPRTLGLEGERVVVVGFGASGRAAANVLASEGARVLVSERRSLEEFDGVTPAGVELRAGGHAPEHLDGATLVVASPGVAPDAPVLGWARERGIPVWSELELGARLCRAPYIAVTGTNGKTTTVELLAAMLVAGGIKARACGNVGYPFSLAAREAWDALAVEASSFQLALQEHLHPTVSVLLNVAPDHLDWHGSFEAYAGAKARVYARQSGGDVHVGNASDPAAVEISAKAPCAVRWFRADAPDAGETGLVEGRVVARPADGRREHTFALPTDDGAFALDAAAAVTAALAFGVAPPAIRSALESFEPLPHRGTVVAVAGSVSFLDDSKATNPHATLAALSGRHDVVLIAGGRAKGIDLSPLRAAAESVSAVVTLGEAAPELEAIFAGLVPTRRAATIEEAVALAFVEARPGGEVILAPACASQDMFRDYAERGDQFAGAATALAAALAKHDEQAGAGDG